ncbi:MAG: ZPR1 zinc finger domain-containing protein [Methanobacterium sp.]|jgi:zinc finger protein|nr:ZPR1 zinc finger domain-containing protein [Methanobacterium sp.]
MELKTKIEEIPYFGEVMESTVICEECGFKHSDVICLEAKKPVKYTLKIGKDKMNKRVVKSQSSTITIPELGLKVEPGPQSQGFVSNIEGILDRFKKAVETALSWSEDEESKSNANRILEDLEEIRTGHKQATLILEDPFGHSLIEDKDAVKSELSSDDMKELKTGFITFEKE